MQKSLKKSSPSEVNPIYLSTDSKGIVLDASESFYYYTGKSKQQVIGFSIADFLSNKAIRENIAHYYEIADTIPQSKEFIVKIGSGRKAKTCQFKITQRKQKGKISFEWKEQSLELQDESIDTVEVQMLHSFLSSNPKPVLAYLPDTGEINYTNPAFSSLYGYAPEFVKGKPIAILHEPSIAASFIRKTYFSKRSEPYSFVVTNIKADQSVFDAEVHTGMVVINDQKFALLYIDDISERIKSARQKRLIDDLSTALQRKETLRRKLDSAIEVLRQFMNWDLGELWLFSSEHKYSMLESFSVKELTSPLKAFIESTLQLKISIDAIAEMPAYKEQSAFWVPDIRKNRFLSRSEQAIDANLKGAISFPLLKDNRLIGGIFLFSEEVQELNHSQFEILNSVMGVLASEIEHQKTIDQYQKFFELSGDLLCIGDLDGRFRKLNSSFLERLGYSEDELLGRSYYGFIHEDDKEKLDNISQRLLLQEELKALELRFRKANGEYIWLSWSAVYSVDHQLLFAAARDISDKKKVEELHRELDEIIGHASEVIFKLDLEGRIIFASPEFERLFKVDSNHILHLHFREVIHPEFAGLCEEGFKKALETRKPVRDIIFRTRENNGQSLWMNTSVVFVFDENNRAKYGIGLAQNITSQRETLKKLEAAEQRYAAFLENSSEAIWRIETKGSISIDLPFEEIMAYFSEHGYLAECNKMFCSMYGYSHPDEMNGMPLAELMPITDENNIQYFRSFVESGFNLSNAESVEYDREGNRKFILNNLIGIIEDRQLIRIWGTQRDITNLRTAEKEVANREEQYRTLAENIPMLIVRFDRDIRFTYVNRAFEQLSALESSFLVGKSLYDLGLEASVCDEIATRCALVFEEGQPDNFTLKVASQIIDNKKYNLLVNLAPEHDENQQICSVILIGHEISPIVEAQEALIYKDQLLASITRIAGQLLREENYRNTIGEALEQLGIGTKADRAFVFENIKGEDGEYYCTHSYEWCKENIMAQHGNPIFSKIPFRYIESYISLYQENEICFAQIIDEIEDEFLKGLLVQAGVQSLLVAPIFVGNEFWGLVGFDDCQSPRKWSEVDEDILKTFASCLAAAIQRKRVEEVVLESEARFKHMADNAPVMIWVSDENDNTVYVNKNWIDFTGRDLSSYSKEFWRDLVHPEDAKLAISHYDELFSQHLPVTMEYRLRSQSGGFRWVIDQAIPRFLSDGTFLGYIGTVLDIHDRKITEEKISYQARVMQEITEAIISTDLDFNVITWNKGAEKIHGVLAKDIVGKKIYEQINYEYIGESREEALQHLFKYGYWSGEISSKRNGDKPIYLFSSLSFITNKHGEHIGLVEVQREITEKKKSEEALRISEERYRTVVNALSEGIMLIDQNGRVITSNKSAELILGSSSLATRKEGVEPALLNGAIQEDGAVFLLENLAPVITLRTGTPTYGQILGVHNTPDEITWLSLNTEPLFFSPDRTKPDAVVLSFIDITQKKKANEELAKNEKQLREYSDRIHNILDSITDGFIAVDNEMRVFLWNHVFETVTGIKAKNALGQKLTDVFPDLFGPLFESFAGAFANNTTVIKEHFSRRYNKWFEISAFPSLQGLFIYFRDITKRKRQELLLALEKEVLELNAKPLITLKHTMDVFLTGMEKVFLGSIFSVLGLKDDGLTIETLSAPHLPEEFCASVNGIKIGPKTGSCGTAMYLKQNVIVSDIATSELWVDYRELALSFNLKACWSFPILSSQNKVLATMAVYNTSIKSPNHDELTNIQRAVNILRIIIENKQSEEKIKVSNERYLLATMATNDAIWDWDMVTNHLYWGEGFHGLFGYKAGYFKQELGIWEKAIHPADSERVVESRKNFIDSNSQQVWQEEYRFKKADGKYVLVSDRGFLIYNQQGKVSRMVGSMQDITEKREMEKKLLKQEINKQKLVAQAVVDAQEKERSLIGKELHDNINQILSTAKLYLEVARNDEMDRVNLIDMSTQGISEAINEIRTISRSLVPSSIGDLGIVDTLQDLVESIKLTRKVMVEFHYNREVDELLTEPQKLMLFRIAQEQVNNVMKHANANNLVIELFSEEGMVTITISDDGQGFDLEQVKQKKGVGLSNISSRAEIFNGKVSIKSAPGKGCTLQINVPITNL